MTASQETVKEISLDVRRDAVLETEFVGHVFHNSVALNPVQCYMWCIHDCRCLSFNYKEKNDTKYCELNEGSHFTNKSSLVKSLGSIYYILRRNYVAKVLNFNMIYKLYFRIKFVSLLFIFLALY